MALIGSCCLLTAMPAREWPSATVIVRTSRRIASLVPPVAGNISREYADCGHGEHTEIHAARSTAARSVCRPAALS
jgi:hypothetical protein